MTSPIPGKLRDDIQLLQSNANYKAACYHTDKKADWKAIKHIFMKALMHVEEKQLAQY